MLNLVIEKFAEIFHIHFALVGVGDGSKAVHLHTVHLQVLYGTDDVTQLAYAGGFDQNAVRMVGLQYLF